MDTPLAGAFAVLPSYLGHHILLSAAALALGTALSLPLALAASHSARLRWPVLTFVSLIQTVPSLALMALFYPVLLAISAASRSLTGHSFSALGFLPSLIALTLYSMLPIIRNTVTAIVNLDSDMIEAARGVGMGPTQRLLRVELPLAAPVIMAGVRTAAVWTIGTATLSTPVGQTSLGNYIFAGLQTENWVWVLFGCITAAALALLVDQLLGLIEIGTARRSLWRVAAGMGILALGVAAAGAVIFNPAQKPAYVVGAKDFTEQYLLAGVIRQRLEAGGHATSLRGGLGSAVVFRALAQGDIDVYVDYSGTIWTNVMGRRDRLPREAMLREISDWLARERGVRMVGALGFENVYALAMKRERAQTLGVTSISDLAKQAAHLRIGGDYEFFARPEWASLRQEYGLQFQEQREFQSTFMYRAVANGDVDVISAFSSDGRIKGEDLLLLSDPKGAIPPYDAIVMVSAKRKTDKALLAALKPLIGAIPVTLMQKANCLVERPDAPMSVDAAAQWLDKQLPAPK